MKCPECESENIQEVNIGLVCLCCGFEMGDIVNHDIESLNTVPIDLRFNKFMDKFFGEIGKEGFSADEVLDILRPYFTPLTSCNDLKRIMKILGMSTFYDACPAIYSLLKRNKCMNITQSQRDSLLSDYKQFVRKFKDLLRERGKKKLPRQDLILKALLLKNNIPFEEDLFIGLRTKWKTLECNKDFQKVFDLLGWNFLPI